MALDPIRQLIKAGDFAQAREQLRPLIKENPNAEIWYMAAQVSEDRARAIYCLKKALALDPLHTPANRLLLKLEGGADLRKTDTTEVVTVIPPPPTLSRREREQRARRSIKRSNWLLVSGVSVILLVLGLLFLLNIIGLAPGFVGLITRLTGGPSAVTIVNGQPIESASYPVSLIDQLPILVSKRFDGIIREYLDILDHGYVHEYNVFLRNREPYAVMIDFSTPFDRDFERNVGFFDPNGNDVTRTLCTPAPSLAPPDPARLIWRCQSNNEGWYIVRLVGIRDESIGVYRIVLSFL